jgi:hypothetical protein
MVQRLGSKGRALFIDENSYGGSFANYDTDVGLLAANTAVMPIADKFAFGTKGDLIEAPVFKGDRQPFSSILGLLNARGDTPIQLEHTFLGRILKNFLGGSSASVATGGGFLHYFPYDSTLVPGSCQFEKQWNDQSPLYIRNKGVRLDSMRYGFTPAGVAGYTLGAMGRGDEVQTSAGLTPNDDGYTGRSYFHGYARLGGTLLAGMTGYDMTVMNDLSREDVGFLAGLAGSINPGIFQVKGNLELMLEVDLSYYNYAVNSTLVAIEMMWANKLLGQETQFYRVCIPLCRFSRGDLWRSAVASASGSRSPSTPRTIRRRPGPRPGRASSSRASVPFAIVGGVNDKVGIKVDGGGTITKTLTAGAARTAAQIVTDIGAVTGGLCDLWPKDPQGNAGRFRLQTNTRGVGGSIAIDTTVAQSAHVVLGLDATVRAGKAPTAFHSWLFNGADGDLLIFQKEAGPAGVA